MKTTPEALQTTVGQRVDLIDTPALVVDLDAMDRNIQRMADFARKHQVRWRPHAKMHKSTELALLLQQAGAQGVCVQKVSEAEALAAGGVRDITITNEVIAMPKLHRAACPQGVRSGSPMSVQKHEAALRATLGRCRAAQRRADQGWRCLRRSRV